MISPEEYLSAAIAPAQAAISNYGQGGIDLAKWQVAQSVKAGEDARARQQAMDVIAAQIQGQKELAGINNKAAMDRVNAESQGYVDRLTAAEKNKFKDYFRNLGLLQSPGESDEDFIKRGNQAVAGQANTLWKSITASQAQADQLLTGEQRRLNGLAYSRAKAQFAQESGLDKKQKTLLNSASVEDVLKTIPPDKRAALEASWNTYLQQAQEQALKEFDPTVMARAGQIKQVIDNLSKAHSRIIDNPNAAGATPFLDFSLPQTSKESGFLSDAKKAPVAGTATAPKAATAPTIPPQLQDPDVLAAANQMAENKYGAGKAWSGIPATPQEILTLAGKDNSRRITAANDALFNLGFKGTDTNGLPLISDFAKPFFVGRGSWGPMVDSGRPISADEKARRIQAATEILSNLSSLKKQQQALQKAGGQFWAADPDGMFPRPLSTNAVSPTQVLALPQ